MGPRWNFFRTTPTHKDSSNMIGQSASWESCALVNSDASCNYSIGDTSVIVSLHGPTEARSSASFSGGLTCDISVRRQSGIPGNTERQLEMSLLNMMSQVIDFTSYPHTQLLVSVEILSGGSMATVATFNAIMIAILKSGIAVRRLLYAVALVYSGGEFTLNPRISHNNEQAVLTALIDPTNAALAEIICQSGNIPLSQLKMLLESGTKLAKDAFRELIAPETMTAHSAPMSA